jgi:hypothetical protein
MSLSLARRATVALGAVLALAALLGTPPSTVGAQRRHREPPPVPADAAVQWTVFVSAFGDQAPHRSTASAEPGTVPLPIAGWSCTYSAPNRAQLDANNWSEMRTLECTHAGAVVSTTGFCQVAGASWGARAAVLSLGTPASEGRVTVTLDCAVQG